MDNSRVWWLAGLFQMQIFVKTMTGRSMTLFVNGPEDTVASVMAQISEREGNYFSLISLSHRLHFDQNKC